MELYLSNHNTNFL